MGPSVTFCLSLSRPCSLASLPVRSSLPFSSPSSLSSFLLPSSCPSSPFPPSSSLSLSFFFPFPSSFLLPPFLPPFLPSFPPFLSSLPSLPFSSVFVFYGCIRSHFGYSLRDFSSFSSLFLDFMRFIIKRMRMDFLRSFMRIRLSLGVPFFGQTP